MTALNIAESESVVAAAERLLAGDRDPASLRASEWQLRLRQEFRNHLQTGQYRGFFLVGPGNLSLASSRDSNIGTLNLLVAQPDVLERLWGGQAMLSRITATDVPLVEFGLPQRAETMFVGAPVRNTGGDVIALLTLRIDPAETLFPILASGRIGETGESYAFDREGYMLSRSRFEDDLVQLGLMPIRGDGSKAQQRGYFRLRVSDPGVDLRTDRQAALDPEKRPLTRMVRSATRGELDRDVDGYRDYRGVPVIGVWLWNEDLGIGLTTEQDVAEAYDLYFFVRILILIGAALMMMVVVAMATVFTRSRHQLEEAGNRIKAVVDTAIDPIIIIDRNGIIESVNPATERLFGYPAANLLHNNISMLMPKSYAQAHDGHLRRYHETGQAQVIGVGREVEAKRADGSVFPIELSVNRLELKSGLRFAGVIRDISERKLSEVRLMQEKDFIRDVLNALSAHIVVLDHQGDILLTNTAWDQFAEDNGLAADAVGVGVNYLAVLDRVKDDTAVESVNGLRRVLRGEQDTFVVEYPCHSPQEQRWFQMRASCFEYLGTTTLVVSHINITQRWLFEKRLESANAELRTMSLVAQNTDNAVVVTDTGGRVTWVNRGFTEISGYALEDVLGRRPGDVLQGPETDMAVSKRIGGLLQKGQRVDEEIVNYTKSGEPYWLHIEIAPVYDEQGELVQFVALEQDITEEKRLLAELQEARDAAERERDAVTEVNRIMSLTSEALDRTGVAEFWNRASDGRVMRVSNRACEHLGYSREELLQMRVSDFDPNFTEERFAELTAPIKQGGWQRFETVHQTRDGHRVPVEITAMYEPGGGERDDIFVCFVIDITERKEAEYLLIQAREDAEEASLEQQRARAFLTTLMDALPVAVFYKDTQGRYLGCNKVFEQAMGVTEEQVRGKTVMELLPGDLAETYHQKDLELMQHPEPQVYEYQIESKTGERRDVLYHKHVFYDENKAVAGLVGAFVDISELKRTERLLAQSKLEAEHANRAKSTFLATMSHEIRTPLNGVVGTMDMLEHTSLQNNQQDLVRTAKESAYMLQGVIDDVLDFSKIEAGRLELESVALSMENLLETVGENLRHQADKVGVELLVYCDPHVPQVMGDPVRLKQILFNLGGNAVKFSKDLPDRYGMVLISISLREAVAQQAELIIEVQDNGIGMSAEVRERLFQPFMQAEGDTTRRFGGTGLGLVITRRLIEMMGGEVKVESEPTRGSTFTVHLALPTLPGEAESEAGSLQGIQVLLVDDQDESTRILESYLQHAGAAVTNVSPDKAVRTCRDLCDRMADSVVVIDNNGDKEVSEGVREQLRREVAEIDLRFVVVERGRRRYPRIDQEDSLTLDLNAMRRHTLLNVVAAATGRESPEHLVNAPSASEERRPLSDDEARAAGRMVLLADDNETNRKVIGQQLGMLGCGVEYAEDGRQALEKWRSGDFDLLLTDCHMPEMDGYELSRSIRKAEQEAAGEGEGRRFPIIAITADAMKGTANKCYAVGMDSYLTKPMQLDELDEVLRKWLGSPAAESLAADSRVAAPPQAAIRGGTDESANEAVEKVDETVVDANVLAALVGSSDPAILAELYQDFLDSNGPTAQQIQAANTAGDFSELGRLAHKMKSAARTMGANDLANTCLALEEACKEGDTQRIVAGMEGFPGLFLKVEAWISRYIEKNR
ncbi:MAG: PAS domain S-box protein [Candidatus Thiodiazotropha taylori]|nr:PAS domain S-box protein [Candidatus Thiodiazotropha taylori]